MVDIGKPKKYNKTKPKRRIKRKRRRSRTKTHPIVPEHDGTEHEQQSTSSACLSKRMENTHSCISNWRPRVFISHCWTTDLQGRNNHERVKSLNNALLCSNTVDTWFDEASMRGNLTQCMCKGIDDADVILVCITREYINKCKKTENDNCKLELDYAYGRKGGKMLLPVVMEHDCLNQQTWDGPVGAYLNKHLYVSCIDDFQIVNSIDGLIQQIKNIKASEEQQSSSFKSFGFQNIIHHWRLKNKIKHYPEHKIV